MKKFDDSFFQKKWVANTIATCSAVILYMVLSHFGSIFSGVSRFMGFIRPVATAVIIAYVLNPFANLFSRKVFCKINSRKARWSLSVLFAIITLAALISLLGAALVPQIADSISTLASNMDSYLDAFQELLHGLESNTRKGILGFDFGTLANIGDTAVDMLQEYLANNAGNLVYKSANVGRNIFDAVMACILAIYFLLDKYRITTGCSKLMYLTMKKDDYEKTTQFMGRCHKIIIRYISVDIIDGLLVGVANFIFMLIMRMPYSVLISVIVGVTNLAPTFGPIIGMVIGGFILVLVEPWQALAFIIFSIVLQTVDGYILKPRLFGGSLGVSSLMILISIILGGRLFGVMGILIAIPFAAILDFTWRDFVIKKLEERHAKRYND